jgi:LmbE family N-acetylglucosaminyl deacetylase
VLWPRSHDSGALLRGRVVIVSPHLDDTVLSLGASVARATRSGAAVVRSLTVFAYGDDDLAVAPWDADCGFSSAAAARAARRAEDARGCAFVGAIPEWLPFFDVEYGAALHTDDELWSRIEPLLAGASAVLVPGFPLAVPDHERLTRLVLSRTSGCEIGLYVEQPYASWRIMSRGGRAGALDASDGLRNTLRVAAGGARGRALTAPGPSPVADLLAAPPEWRASAVRLRDVVAKHRAIRAHASQVRGFGPLVATRIALHERAWGGEGIAWVRLGQALGRATRAAAF